MNRAKGLVAAAVSNLESVTTQEPLRATVTRELLRTAQGLSQSLDALAPAFTGDSANALQVASQAVTILPPLPEPEKIFQFIQLPVPAKTLPIHTYELWGGRGPGADFFALGLYTTSDGMLYVRGTRKDSPAAKLGLKIGDFILGVNGTAVRTPGEFAELVRRYRGQPAEITVDSDGKRKTRKGKVASDA